VGEAGADLASVDEVGVRPPDVTGLEDPEHAEPPFEVPLFDAVDVRLFEEPRCAIDPAPAPAQVALEPEALSELAAEVRRAVHGTVGQADLVGSHPQGEARLVVTSQVAGRCRAVEIVDVEALGTER
jgi:hypothetical protein